MIAALAAAAVTLFAPDVVLAKYRGALALLHEPRVFTVTYTLDQTSTTRSLQQTHRIFRSGSDERDELIAVNGTRLKTPTVRIFRGRRYRYAATSLAPSPAAYAFAYAGTRKDGRHVDYVFRVAPHGTAAFAFTSVTIDGVSFLPAEVAFASAAHAGRGTVTFAKADRYWVASGATASAKASAGDAHERLSFSGWRFPPSLPRATFNAPRPLATPLPAR